VLTLDWRLVDVAADLGIESLEVEKWRSTRIRRRPSAWRACSTTPGGRERCRSAGVGGLFVLQPARGSRSPLDVCGVKANLRPGELLDIMREIREGPSANRRENRCPRRARWKKFSCGCA